MSDRPPLCARGAKRGSGVILAQHALAHWLGTAGALRGRRRCSTILAQMLRRPVKPSSDFACLFFRGVRQLADGPLTRSPLLGLACIHLAGGFGCL